jgi:hypothetical protein
MRVSKLLSIAIWIVVLLGLVEKVKSTKQVIFGEWLA